jgi:aryl-alcohol dehydrogenase-like predicted oxidoreductase
MGGSMPRRQLGKNGPKVSAIGYGSMGLSVFYGTPASDEERFKVLDRVIELGSTYIDTADMYGDSEDLLGKYFQKYPQKRQKVNFDYFDMS